MSIIALVLLAGLSSSEPMPQTSEDWDLTRTDDAVLASVSFSGGFNVGIRCRDRVFDVVIGGLEPGEGRRSLKVAMGDEPMPDNPESWLANDRGTIAFSLFPAPLARRMRSGGPLRLTLVNDGSDGQRYEYALPSSEAAINAVFTACDVATTDVRYERPPFPTIPRERAWAVISRPEFPSQAASQDITTGIVGVSCVISESGHPTDCKVESERPANVGFGAAVLQGARRARLDMSGVETTTAPYIAEFTTSFRVE